MSDEAFHLSVDDKKNLLERYRNKTVLPLHYGTVADYCDSCDHVPFLPHIQRDLKDMQRPAAVKMIVAACSPGSSLLEIGAGEPYVAQMLLELGYEVTVVDPYDGSGRGPTEFEYYKQKYPDVRIVRDLFSAATDLAATSSFDCIYSISVLEHVHEPYLTKVFQGIEQFLRDGGYSIHLIDHVLAGEGAEFHLQQVASIVNLNARLNRRKSTERLSTFHNVLTNASNDVETFFLSAEGHNLWRGPTSYSSFPFRKVISVHCCEKYVKSK